MIERTDSKIEVEGIVFYQIRSTIDFEIYGNKISKGQFGGYVCPNSRLKNSWIDSGIVLNSILENFYSKDTQIKNCKIKDAAIYNGNVVENIITE